MASITFPTTFLHSRHVFLLSLAFLLMSPFAIPAQGRPFPGANLMKNEELAVKMRGLIGSRPPRCEGRCRNCGTCEAVQVPIAGSIKKLLEQEMRRIEYSRGDDISNYKPMCWKCKCGDVFFNP